MEGAVVLPITADRGRHHPDPDLPIQERAADTEAPPKWQDVGGSLSEGEVHITQKKLRQRL